MANPLLGQILGGVIAHAMRGRARSGPYAREPVGGAGLGDLLGGKAAQSPISAGTPFGGRGPLVAMLLPVAMRWVQHSGGLGEVLRRFEQKGHGGHANSWVSTGPNNPLKVEELDEVMGGEELSRLSRQLHVSEREVGHALAQILPELVDQLTPEGRIPPEADDALDAALSELERELALADLHSPA